MRRMAEDWTRDEVELLVTDYFGMFVKSMLGEPFVKAAHNRELRRTLTRRSVKSIENKYGNVSAVLRELGWPWVQGVTPRNNYQGLLAVVVGERLAGDGSLLERARDAATRTPADPPVTNHLVRLENPPAFEPGTLRDEAPVEPRYAFIPSPDYTALEARNRALGLAGELWVLDQERRRLEASGAGDLALKVEHVAVTVGDGLGYDIRSFDEAGRERWLEVKTTTGGREMPFFVSRNELRVSRESSGMYRLCRVFAYSTGPRWFALDGALDSACRLDAIAYSARFN